MWSAGASVRPHSIDALEPTRARPSAWNHGTTFLARESRGLQIAEQPPQVHRRPADLATIRQRHHVTEPVLQVQNAALRHKPATAILQLRERGQHPGESLNETHIQVAMGERANQPPRARDA